ncbi:MAG: hypothetical protein JO066_02550 [Verrucomicrobia bacterium]|nr:hypothetical protein [Verrucomicrobiota bacterium]
MQSVAMIAAAISVIVLWWGGRPWQYALLFGISGLAGMMSIHLVRRIRGIEIGEESSSSGHPAPWLEILKHPPFTKLLEGRADYTARQALAISRAEAVRAFASVPFFGLVLERTGSKPLLKLATFFLAKPLVERKGKPFETAIRDVVILAGLKLYVRFFDR